MHERNDTLIRATTQVRTIGAAAPRTFGDGHRNVGYQAGDQIVTWQDDDGFYGCLQGIGDEGNWYESDDLGPFATRAEAEDAAQDFYDEAR